MGVLRKEGHERFAKGLALGVKSVHQCYLDAGYSSANPKQSFTMARRQDVIDRVAELRARADQIDAQSTEQALVKAGVTKLKIIEELALIGFARMEDYLALDLSDHPVVDLSELKEQDPRWAAVKAVTTDTYYEGHGDDAREVKKVRIELYDKKPALLALAGFHGMLPKGSGNGDTNNTQINVYLSERDARL